MIVIFVVGMVVALAILSTLIGYMKELFSSKYSYNIYKPQVLGVLLLVFILLGVFWMGLNEEISKDNMIAAVVIAALLWLAVLIFNLIKTTIIAGIIVTLFQLRTVLDTFLSTCTF